MIAALWIALGLAVGSAATLIAMRPMLARRYQDGIAAGYVARYEDEPSRVKTAYNLGKEDGKAEMVAAVWRDIGTVEMQRLVQRIEVMDRVDAITRGKFPPDSAGSGETQQGAQQ